MSKMRLGGPIRGFIKLSGGTTVSRITGMLREMVMAQFLGGGSAMDAFLVAFTLPNLLRRMFGERVMESAMMPVYKKLTSEDAQKEASIVVKTTIFFYGGLALLIAAAGMVFTPLLVSLFAPGFDPETHLLAITMTRIMFPFLIVISIASLMGAVLLAHERFGPYSLAPALFNIVVISFMVLGTRKFGAEIAAWGVLAGVTLECLILIPFLPAQLSLLKSPFKFKNKNAKTVRRLSAPLIFETLLDKTVVLVDRRLASLLTTGSIASLGYAFRLIQLPYGILALAIARAYYPGLVKSSASHEKFIGQLSEAIKAVFLLMVPCTIIMIVLREPIVRLVYWHGAFDESAVAMTSIAFACYGVGIVGMAYQALLSRAFNALLDTKTPVFVSIGLTLANIVLNYLFVQTRFQHAGLALASSTAYILASLALFISLKRKLKLLYTVPVNFGIKNIFCKILIASLISGTAAYSVALLLGQCDSKGKALVIIALAGIAAVLVYLAVLLGLGVNPGSIIKKKSEESNKISEEISED